MYNEGQGLPFLLGHLSSDHHISWLHLHTTKRPEQKMRISTTTFSRKHDESQTEEGKYAFNGLTSKNISSLKQEQKVALV